MTSPITTHILNLQSGSPASGVTVELVSPENMTFMASTDSDGRVAEWDKDIVLCVGGWTLIFAVEKWFHQQQEKTFYSDIVISFNVVDTQQHYHVPLLLSAYGYSTYRGS